MIAPELCAGRADAVVRRPGIYDRKRFYRVDERTGVPCAGHGAGVRRTLGSQIFYVLTEFLGSDMAD